MCGRYVCLHMHMYIGVPTYMTACESQKLTQDVFNHSLPHFWRLSLAERGAPVSARLAIQKSPGIHLSLVPSAGVTDTHHSTHFCTLELGIQTLVLMLSNKHFVY